MKTARPAVASAARYGAITGITLVYLALIGVFEQFSDVHLVAGLLSIGHAVWYGTTAAVGYKVGREQPGVRGLPPALVSGAVAGLFLAALYTIGNCASDLSEPLARVCPSNLRAMFVNATTELYALLDFGRDGPAGLLLLVASCAAASGAGWALTAMPGHLRSAVLRGFAAVVIVATLEDLLKSVRPLRELSRMVYTNDGLAPLAALLLFASVAGARELMPAIARPVRARVERMPEAGQLRLRRQSQVVGGLFFVAFLLVLPFAAGNYVTDVLDTIGLFVLMGLGLNIVVGYAGLLDLGYVAFYALGAYSVAVLTSPAGGIELGFWTALPLAVVFTTLSGVVLGVPVLKTHGDYLAIITLGFGEIIRILLVSDMLKPWIGGAQGIKEVSKSLDLGTFTVPFVGRVDPSFQVEAFYPIAAACAVFTYVAWRLRNSRFGRGWMAVREDEPVAAAIGVDLVRTKLFAFAAGAAMAGTAGALLAAKLQTVFPQPFGLLVSINVLVMIIVGGMGSIPGVYVGALVLVGLPEVLREFNDYRLLLYGALLVAMMLKRPAGLWPAAITKRELQ